MTNVFWGLGSGRVVLQSERGPLGKDRKTKRFFMYEQHSQSNRNRNLAASWETLLGLAGRSMGSTHRFAWPFLLEVKRAKKAK